MGKDGDHYSILWEDRGTVCEFSGDLKIEDIDEANERLSHDPRYYKHSYSIWDYSNSNLSRVHSGDLMSAVAMDLGAAVTLGKFKVGLVAADEHSRDLCEVYVRESKRFRSPWTFKVFAYIDEARAWVEE